jgi:hypothetical protein
MKCPGQDMKYWKASAIFDSNCPKCGKMVEFYKDDTSRKCGNCGHRFVNPKMDFGCASYCQYADQCMGSLPEEFTGSRDNLLKDKVAVEMKRFFQTDFKRIRQATTAARYAENIGKAEGGNLAIILCAAYLHDTGPAGAETILKKVGAKEPMIEEICLLIEQQQKVKEDGSVQAKILHDTLMLNYLHEEFKEGRINSETVQQLSHEKLFTTAAKTMAATLAG